MSVVEVFPFYVVKAEFDIMKNSENATQSDWPLLFGFLFVAILIAVVAWSFWPGKKPAVEGKSRVADWMPKSAAVDKRPVPQSPPPKPPQQTVTQKRSTVSATPRVTQPVSELRGHTHAILAWNVESGDNDPRTIAKELKELRGYDVYCLCEVHPDSFGIYAEALGEEFGYVKSKTGGGDRQMILYRRSTLNLVSSCELDDLNNGHNRSPLVATPIRILPRR